MKTRVLLSPPRYVQGAGAINTLPEQLERLGTKALVVADPFVVSNMKDTLETALGTFPHTVEKFGGECTKQEIQRLKDKLESVNGDIVVGIGGGKTLDTAKAVAYYAECPVVIVPTIAATDAPCSALSVVYTPEGEFEEYLLFPQNPSLVLVDTAIIAQAPARFLVAGMGDALATRFEAEACYKSNAKNMAGGGITMAALNLARLCYDTLLEYGYQAKLAAEKHVVTPALERVVEANTLLSGLGFESGGLAAAHAIHDGLTVLEETHNVYHGEKVAFSTIVQLVMEDRSSDEIYEVLEFCYSVGLPITLEELGLSAPSKEDLMKVARASVAEGETIHNMPFPVTAELVYNAIVAADALGQDLKKGL